MGKERVKVGVVGCGNISAKYLHSMTQVFKQIEVVAVNDLKEDNARLHAEEFHIPTVCATLDELLSMEEIEIVVVLTNPAQHFPVVEKCLLAGKHTYVEKPLSLNTQQGKRLLQLAHDGNLLLSGAPDTILGAGMQTARKLIEDGWIGQPTAAISHILTAGPESWHPNPAFLYHKGAGPLYDVAPYYVAGLTYLFGSAESVYCSAKRTYDRRVIRSQPLYGTMIDVEVPTFLAGVINMESGVICTIHHSFDVLQTKLDNRIEVYGTKGTLVVPTPCDFSGETLYRGRDDEQWSSIPPLFSYSSDCRGIGVADMADALLHNRAPRLNDRFVYHTLDVLEKLDISWQEKQSQRVESRFEATPLMPSTAIWS